MHGPADLVAALAALPAPPDAVNPYAGADDDSARRRGNLQRYLTTMQARAPAVLLLLEAPGYRGCRLTGVPVTSRKILRDGVPALALFGAAQGYQATADAGFEDIDGEQSASIVWHTLAGLAVAPLIWNTYPLHPHRPGQPRSNRPPRRPEIALGEDFVRHIVALYAPRRIIAVGGVAAGALARLSLAGERIRHPAQGGKAAFVAGLTRLLSPDTAS